VAYSSISHMGYVMLGMAAFTPGHQRRGAQMFNHAAITACSSSGRDLTAPPP
jgi:NADH:ubiquinone oxidoreductase subunit 4 (subunit M)